MKLNYIKLYFCLTLSGLTLLGVVELYLSYQLHTLEKELKARSIQNERDEKAAAVRRNLKEQEIKKYQAEQTKIRTIEQNKINNARKTNDQTCQFWAKEYSEFKSERNKLMMDGACERARND
ncbi:hypothetical protein [Pseudoalteromonas arctica]|uniref:Uncharacterized protein n=1 Tax=Pseudoalteromonas arctica TaxID=394751 RepID=A0A7Y0DQD4_9GAMM|nr:hypothetical protein [Pseudoalteromonas arctica]NMM39674.1 hypothetical protein [Pseudoalteromonas arctica]